MKRIAWGAAFAVLALSACKKDPNSEGYWKKQLEKDKTRTPALIEIADKLSTPEQKAWAAKLVVGVFDKDPSRAATALRKLGIASSDVAAKIDSALRSKDPSVMPSAAATAMALNLKQAEPALVEILSGWTTANPQLMRDVRVEVMRALGHFESKAAIPALTTVAGADSATKVERYEALRALSKVADARATPAFIAGLFLPCAMDRCSAVSRIGLNRIGVAAIPALLKAIERKDPVVEQLAKEKKLDENNGQVTRVPFVVLGDIADAATVRKLAAKYLGGEPNFTKVNALVALGYAGSPELAEALQESYEKPVLEIRTNALHALHRTGSRSALPFLTGVIRKNEDPNLVWTAGLAVSFLGGEAELGLVEATWKKAAANAKSMKGEDQALAKQTATFFEQFTKRLRAAKGCTNDACWAGKLKDADKEVRTKAARMLAWAKDKPVAEAALIGALADAENDVREELAFALGKVGSAKAVPALRERLTADKEKGKLRESLFLYELVAARLAGRGA